MVAILNLLYANHLVLLLVTPGNHSVSGKIRDFKGWGIILGLIAGSLEAAYSLNWDAREIWGKGGGETLALL